MNSVQRSLALVRLCTRQYGSTPIEQLPKRIQRLKAKQAKFQIDDGLPVHLKGGLGDKILYQTTFILCFIGLAMSAKVFYDLSVPKK